MEYTFKMCKTNQAPERSTNLA